MTKKTETIQVTRKGHEKKRLRREHVTKTSPKNQASIAELDNAPDVSAGSDSQQGLMIMT